MIDEAGLAGLRSALEPDGYGVEVTETDSRVAVQIVAGPEACADCLAPEPVMKGVVAQLLGVEEASVDLAYPD